jgi:tetratricopeptide (TPR) repeat protein
MASIVFVGNCQAQAIAVLFERYVCDRRRDRSAWVSSISEVSQEDRRLVEGADLLVEQVFDWQQKGSIDPTFAHIRRAKFPLVAARFLWPFAGGAHVQNTPLLPELRDGPYPWEQGDAWLNAQIVAGAGPDAAVESYLALDVRSVHNLDRIFQLDVHAQRTRDKAADIEMGSIICSEFRRIRLFNSPHHPNLPLLKLLATAVFRSISADEVGIQRMNRYVRENPLSDDSLPIHPAVARHFELEYGDENHRYPFHADGPFTFAEYSSRYMRYDFNHALVRGMYLESKGAITQAVVELEVGLGIAPNAVPGLLALGRAFAALRRFNEASEVVGRALELEPGNVRGHVQLGDILFNRGLIAASWESYERALRLDPDYLRANHLGSFALDRLGRSAEGAELARRALDADPTNADLNLHYGNLLVNAHKDAAAEEAFRRAFDLGARRADTLAALARILARQKKLDEALATAREAAALAPGDSSMATLCTQLAATLPPVSLPSEPDHVDAAAGRMFFAANQTSDQVVLFPALLPPPQKALVNEAMLPADVLKEHYDYAMPAPVSVYSLTGFRLCGVGLFRRDQELFYKDDVLPPYFEPHLQTGGRPLPAVWAGTLYQSDVPTRHLESPCFCPFHPNIVYGHFLLEILPKLYIWHVLKEYGDTYPLLLPTGLPRWILDFVDLFIDRRNLCFYDAAREAVEAPSFILASMMHTNHNFHPSFNLALNHAVRSALGLPKTGVEAKAIGATNRRLYLSRRRTRTAWHSIVNEREIESVFADIGFEILHPQEMTVAEQICIFSEANVVAGEYSSALHNTIFSPAGTTVISLNRINWYQSRIGRLKQQRIAYIPPADGVWRDWRAGRNRADFIMDCEQVRRVALACLADLACPA